MTVNPAPLMNQRVKFHEPPWSMDHMLKFYILEVTPKKKSYNKLYQIKPHSPPLDQFLKSLYHMHPIRHMP